MTGVILVTGVTRVTGASKEGQRGGEEEGDVTNLGQTNEQTTTKKDRATQPMDAGRLRRTIVFDCALVINPMGKSFFFRPDQARPD